MADGCCMRLQPLARSLLPEGASGEAVERVAQWLREQIDADRIPAANISTHPEKRLLIVPPAGQVVARELYIAHIDERITQLHAELELTISHLRALVGSSHG